MINLQTEKSRVYREFPSKLSYEPDFVDYFWLFQNGTIDYQHGQYALDPAMVNLARMGKLDIVTQAIQAPQDSQSRVQTCTSSSDTFSADAFEGSDTVNLTASAAA